MDRQDLAFLLGIVAIDCSRCDASPPPPRADDADPPLPDWSGAYLEAFDRFLEGDPEAPLVMRRAAGENVPRGAP
jgi:hypothetical protein